MNTADKLNKLLETKQAIKQSIINKGVEITDTTPFADYPSKIDSIESGGGNGNSVYEAHWNLKTKDNVNYFRLFYGYTGTELDVSKLDTSNVTDMAQMFYKCNKLTSIDVSNWDTSNVTNMNNMFYDCYNLKTLDLSNWDTNNVTDMNNMFSNCNKLTSIDASNWNTSNVTNMQNMFYYCNSLHTLRLDNCDNATISKIINSTGFPTNAISGVTRIIYCEEAHAAGLKSPTNWRFSFESEEKPYKFTDNADITEVTGDTVTITSEHTDLSYMFSNCVNLMSVDASNWDTSCVTNMSYMFNNCYNLTTIDGINDWLVGTVNDMTNMFNSCSYLWSLDLSNWDTSSVNYMSGMFSNCSGLAELNISNFDTSNVWDDANEMFSNCYNLYALHLDNCSYDTISKIINSSNFPTDEISTTRTIYCREENVSGLEAPYPWVFEYVY